VFLCVRGTFWRKTLIATTVSVVAVLLVSYRLIDNVLVFGSPIADFGAVPVYALPQLDWEAYFREARGIATFADQWLVGFLAGLSQPKIYGITYWLFLCMLFVFVRRQRRSNAMLIAMSGSSESNGQLLKKLLTLTSSTRIEWLALLVVLQFYAMVFVSVVLGMDAFIKNYRYMMTTLPLLVIFVMKSFSPFVESWLSALNATGREDS